MKFNRDQIYQENEIYEADEDEESKNDAHILKKVLKDPGVHHLAHKHQILFK